MDVKIIFLIAVLTGLGFCVYKTRRRRSWSNFFLSLFVILLVLLITEFVYRNFFGERKIISTVNSYYQPDSLIGYHFDPGIMKAVEYFENGDTIYNTYYTIVEDTNKYGMKYPMRRAYKSDTSVREVVFLGCSFTLGEGLADEETLPYQYGQITGVSTINRACNGLGVHQVYQLFKSEYGEQDNHNRTFVYSFFSEHFFRALGLYSWNVAGPYFTVSEDSLVNHGPYYKSKPLYAQKLAHYGSFLGAFSFIKDNVERITLKKQLQIMTLNRAI